MLMRIADVTLGTVRTLMVVQARKYQAGFLGFIEVTIWIFAIRHIMLHLDNLWNILGYSTGFAFGNILGIYVEQKFGGGFVQLYTISLYYADKIADELRRSKFGVTILPAEGGRGGIAVLVVLTTRKRQNETIKIIDRIDPKAFISIQSATPYR
jgi:uncharacterized protein YebE (UPF0316 family)